ncbi:MAG: DUF5668 domain-containing protein [Candidatus Eisenbacteria bacterium]
MDDHGGSGDRWSGVIWGLILVAVGGVLLADRFIEIPGGFWSSWWTYLVMGVGVVRIVTARDAKRLSEGVGCVLFGAWLWISMTGWMGLNWSRSWPLILIAIGAQELTRGIAAHWMPEPPRKEARHG